jgi:methyl-accepting chemotaxis protein
MKEPHSTFQEISIRRRVVISLGILSVLIMVIGLYGLVAIVESNRCLHKSIIEGKMMANAIDTARLSQVHFKKQVQEWKNILLRGNHKDLYDKHLKAFNEEDRKVNEYLQSLSQIVSGTGMSVPQIADSIKVHEELGQQYREALKKYQQSDLKSAVLVDKSVRGIDRELTDNIDAVVGIIKNLAEKRLKETELIAKTQMEAYKALSFFLIFLIIAGVGFGIYNAMSIIKDLPAEANENSSEQ